METPELKIHDCSELPGVTDIGVDSDCLTKVSSLFQATIWRGNGQYGFVIETMAVYGNPPRDEALIVKISGVNAQELRVACELNTLGEETFVFPHTYGWLVSPRVPDEWLLLLRIHEREHTLLMQPPPLFMFTFVQPVARKWDDAVLAAHHGYRVALFFLLHGLYVARRTIGFNHGDIHAGNIMIQYYARRSDTRLSFGQYEAQIESNFVPRFIDYGRASSSKHREALGASDLRQLRKTFDERLEFDMDNHLLGANEEAIAFNRFVVDVKWREAEDRYGTHGNSELILPMLQHSYFDVPEIERRQVKKQALEPIQRCFSCCASDPRYQINHKTAAPKYFCNPHCYKAMHAICQFIK